MDTELNMLDRAKRIGPELGKIESAKTELNSQMEKLWTDILDILANRFGPGMQNLVDIAALMVTLLRQGIATADQQLAALDVLKAAITVWDPTDDAPAAKALKDATDKLKDIQKEVQAAWGAIGNNNPNQPAKMDPLLEAILNQNI
jgi:phage-related minor tail protein